MEALVICAGSLFFALVLHRNAVKPKLLSPSPKKPMGKSDWLDFARPLFFDPQTSPALTEERVDSVLKAALDRLGLKHAFVLEAGEGDEWRVLASVASQSSYGPGLKIGETVDPESIYCGQLRMQDSIYIEFAGFSRWRNHKAYKERGWETYLGSRRLLQNGSMITVAFVDLLPRDRFFSAAEKEILQKSAQWIAVLLDRNQVGSFKSELEEMNPRSEANFFPKF